MVPALAAALTLGAVGVSHAQVNFIDTNVELAYVSTVSGNGVITSTTNNVVVTYPAVGAREAYTLNGSGVTDAAVRDGSGAGAFIRLSVAGNGLRETSFQSGQINNSVINYQFNVQIFDVNSGLTGVAVVPITLTSAFNAGSNGGDNVTATLPGTLTLGTTIYNFTQFSFTPPSAAPTTGGTSATDGAFSLRVQATAVPEPGSVALLVGMTVTGVGAFARRRSRRSLA